MCVFRYICSTRIVYIILVNWIVNLVSNPHEKRPIFLLLNNLSVEYACDENTQLHTDKHIHNNIEYTQKK